MSEFEELSKDEIRMIREVRAQKAIESRPVESGDAVGPLRNAIVAMVHLAIEFEPKAEVWPQVAGIMNTHGVWRP